VDDISSDGSASAAALDIASLRRKIEAGWSPKYLLFWGHRAKRGEAIGKHVLSQWWPCAFTIDAVQYRSAEHYMMAEKARLFGDNGILRQILEAPSPGAAKALGRKIEPFDEARWAAACFDIVVRGNAAKFGQDDALRDYFLATGDQVLVEASPVDRIWGIGLAADDPRARNPSQWEGTNLLGFALMQARALLASATAPALAPRHRQ
jgi:ribA/ribD-fused uncharacterized protein